MTDINRGALVKLTGAGWTPFGSVGIELGSQHEITGFWGDGTPVIKDSTGEEWGLSLHAATDDPPYWGATLITATSPATTD